MTQALETLELARSAREDGFFAVLGAGGQGLASPGAVRVRGRDALTFIHSQVTNEVEGLAPGEGNYSPGSPSRANSSKYSAFTA